MKAEGTIQLSSDAAAGKKAPQWTREKISQLIQLYKRHECLWNHWHESYKCKVKRNRAIEEICYTMRITKFDFGRKIHNLRNQFNTEMKKLEQRVGEAGVSVVDDPSAAQRCKWVHFESLMFLRDVIEPRPGGYQCSYPATKKMRLRFDYNSAEDDVNVTMLPNSNDSANASSSQHNEEISSQIQQYDEEDTNDVSEEYHNFEVHDDQKYQPIAQQSHSTTSLSTMNVTNITSNTRPFLQATMNQKTSQTSQIINSSSQRTSPITTKSSPHREFLSLCNDDSSIIELNGNNVTVISSSTASPAMQQNTAPSNTLCTSTIVGAGGGSPNKATTNFVSTIVEPSVSHCNTTANKSTAVMLAPTRDQWDAFGELVATEFRNLNSDLSRKKLKRKIMHAMLEVGEEDDEL